MHSCFEGHTVIAIIIETMVVMAMAADAIKEFGCLLGAPLPGSPPFISNPKELGGYNATDDGLHSGHPIWHVLAELRRDSGSMSLGTPLL